MALQRLIDTEPLELWLRRIFNAVNFPRTTTDVLRVNLENTTLTSNINAQNSTTSMQAAAAYAAPFTAGAWNAMDAREPQRELSEQHFVITRQRWNIT